MPAHYRGGSVAPYPPPTGPPLRTPDLRRLTDELDGLVKLPVQPMFGASAFVSRIVRRQQHLVAFVESTLNCTRPKTDVDAGAATDVEADIRRAATGGYLEPAFAICTVTVRPAGCNCDAKQPSHGPDPPGSRPRDAMNSSRKSWSDDGGQPGTEFPPLGS